MIYKSLTDLIGNTPLLEVNGFEGQKARLILKIEAFNPGGSVKDRIALQMIRDAEKDGLLQSGATIIEPTSGNTGVGLAWVGTSKGYKVILTMPESMSLERRNLLAALGARLELTPASQGMKGAIAISLSIPPIPSPTSGRPPRKSGGIPMERSTCLSAVSGPAGRSAAPEGP